MAKEISYDYIYDLDILHVYSSDIKEGVKEGISIGDINIDIGNDNKVVGKEIKEASKLFLTLLLPQHNLQFVAE